MRREAKVRPLTFAWNRGCREASTRCFRRTLQKPRPGENLPQWRPQPTPLGLFWSLDVMARGFSFVISKESRSGPGLHGPPGFVASWRPIDVNKPAIKVGGSPFDTFAEAEKACEAFLSHLTS